MSNIHHLPHDHFRKPLPDDAEPIGREQHLKIHPQPGAGWDVLLISGDGCFYIGEGLTKPAALKIAVSHVLKWNATLSLENEWGA